MVVINTDNKVLQRHTYLVAVNDRLLQQRITDYWSKPQDALKNSTKLLRNLNSSFALRAG